MKSFRELVKLVAEREGLKVSVGIGNIREVLGIASDIVYASPGVIDLLYKNGKRRAKAKLARARKRR